jgi:hypothetical protein
MICLTDNLSRSLASITFTLLLRLSTTLVFVAMMTTAKISLSHRNMICAAIQVLRSRDTLALINQNKESIHDPTQSGHS